jgi:hypothetical protein
MTQEFFNEAGAKALGEPGLLMVAIPKISLRRNAVGDEIELTLPNPDHLGYTDTREGRIQLENVEHSPLVELAKTSIGKTGVSEIGFIRGMSGGIFYLIEDAFVLQQKVYPKSGDRYFSGFTGISGSLADIKDPRRIIAREGTEELVVWDSEAKTLLTPDLASSDFFQGVYTAKDIERFARTATDSLTGLLSNARISPIPNFTENPPRSLTVEITGNTDRLTMYDSTGQELSSSRCIIDINPRNNTVEIMKIAKLGSLPRGAFLYESEFGNDIAVVPFTQLKDMWHNWGDDIRLHAYLKTRTERDVSYRGLFDTLVQSVAMQLGVIKGELRFSYKNFGKDSV